MKKKAKQPLLKKKKYFLVKLKNEASYFEQLALFEVVFSKDLESFDNDASS